LAKWKNIFIK